MSNLANDINAHVYGLTVYAHLCSNHGSGETNAGTVTNASFHTPCDTDISLNWALQAYPAIYYRGTLFSVKGIFA
jgi:hypothetical protein